MSRRHTPTSDHGTGTVAIPGFRAYLAIFAVVMIVSFAALDPDLLRERMRPGGKKPPLAA